MGILTDVEKAVWRERFRLADYGTPVDANWVRELAGSFGVDLNRLPKPVQGAIAMVCALQEMEVSDDADTYP